MEATKSGTISRNKFFFFDYVIKVVTKVFSHYFTKCLFSIFPNIFAILKIFFSNFSLPERPLNSEEYHSIYFKARLKEGKKVQLFLSYGNQSESIDLYKKTDIVQTTFCYDLEDPFEDIFILMHSYQDSEESVLEFTYGWKDISLKLGEPPKNTTITPRSPATFLIRHAYRDDAHRDDRFVLNVETLNQESENVCMVVSVYNYECPLKNKAYNIRSAQLWATALKSATITIRADKFCFESNFYVSVVVPPDDGLCLENYVQHAGEKCNKTTFPPNYSKLDTRVKEISVKIEKVASYSR